MNLFTEPGTFFTGCNYWASHAGTAMWSDWRKDIVESDFKKLSDAGIKVLRVFPLWSEFQPIKLLRGFEGKPVECRFDEEILPDDMEGRAGISKIAVSHFEEFVKLADKYDLKLIVSLVTGWMSGRLFAPPALEGRNLLMDPYAIMWEVRFVKYFVSKFRECQVIVAWDLGNEFDCMAEAATAEAAWNWTSSITNAIKSIDASRPVASGMHGMTTDGVWTIQDQAEITDVLTVHPYPLFTPYCDQDPINTVRNGLHAVAEMLYYRGIGNKPCFAEEMGTIGPVIVSDEVAGEFIRNNLFTQWAHDCRGFPWWCANDQDQLTHAPYDWKSIESELGLFRSDGTPKPVLAEISKFTAFIESFPYEKLPRRIVDGICILTKGQDAWGVAFSTFILAKQAGLDIEYQYSTQPIKDAELYLLPSIEGTSYISKHRMHELLKRVENGASLYISSDSGLLGSFDEYSGIRVLTRERCSKENIVTIDGINGKGKVSLTLSGSYKFNLEVVNTEIIGIDQDGRPAFTCASYGKGKVFFLNYPIENYLKDKPGIFHERNAKPYWTIYKHLKKSIDPVKAVSSNSPSIGITEHIVNESKRIVIAINYEPEPINAEFNIAGGWKIIESLYGDQALPVGSSGNTSFLLNKNDAAIFVINNLYI